MRLEGWPRATTFRAAILRDARLRQAPKDEDRKFEDAFVLVASLRPEGEGSRLEGWPLALPLRPSFETHRLRDAPWG